MADKKKKKPYPVPETAADYIPFYSDALLTGDITTDEEKLAEHLAGTQAKYGSRQLAGEDQNPSDAARHAMLGYKFMEEGADYAKLAPDHRELGFPGQAFLSAFGFHANPLQEKYRLGTGPTRDKMIQVRRNLQDAGFDVDDKPFDFMTPSFKSSVQTLDIHNNRIGQQISAIADSEEEAQEIIDDLMKNIRTYESLEEMYEDPPKRFEFAVLVPGVELHDRPVTDEWRAVRPLERDEQEMYDAGYTPEELGIEMDPEQRMHRAYNTKYTKKLPRVSYEHESELTKERLKDRPMYRALADKTVEFLPEGMILKAPSYAAIMDVDKEELLAADTDKKLKDLAVRKAREAAQVEYRIAAHKILGQYSDARKEGITPNTIFPDHSDGWWLNTPVDKYEDEIKEAIEFYGYKSDRFKSARPTPEY